MLNITDYSLSFRGSDKRLLPVLENVSLQLAGGRCLGLAGESGSGKSVLAMSIAGLLPAGIVAARSGQIFFENNELTALGEEQFRKLRGREIGFIFQEPMTAMNPLMTLYSQISETLFAHIPGISSAEVDKKVLQALTGAGFSQPEKFLSSYPHQLSGGMRQRAMIAMATVMEPKLLIADEPTTAIDAGLQVQLLRELRSRIDKENLTLIFISHDLGVLSSVADMLAIMYCGCLVEYGEAKKIINRPAHPYAADLVSALPRLTKEKKLPVPIPGFMPAPDQKPTGCVYVDRCSRSKDICRSRRPVPQEVSSEHIVACFFPLAEGDAL